MIWLCAFGGIGGVGLWIVAEILSFLILDPQLQVLILSFSGIAYGATLAMAFLAPVPKAIANGLLLAIPISILLTLSSREFTNSTEFLLSSYPFAGLLLLMIAGPFLISRGQKLDRSGVYAARYDATILLFSRSVIALGAVILFFIAFSLSGFVLRAAGFSILARISNFGPVPFLIIGAGLGGSFAAADQILKTAPPHHLLKIVRVVVPIGAALVAVYLLACLLGKVGADFGPAGRPVSTLLFALISMLLITIAVSRDELQSVRRSFHFFATQGLSVMLPVLGIMPLSEAISMLLNDGWTPQVMAIMLASLFIIIGGMSYAIPALFHYDWMARIRGANMLLAPMAFLFVLAWLNPFLSPTRFSANDQLQRYADGLVSPLDVNIDRLMTGWGNPGREALEAMLLVDRDDKAVLKARLTSFEYDGKERDLSDQPNLRSATLPNAGIDLDALSTTMPIHPPSAKMPAQLFDILSRDQTAMMSSACARVTIGGNPGCVLVVEDMNPNFEGSEVMMFLIDPTGTLNVLGFYNGEDVGRLREGNAIPLNSVATIDAEELLDQINAGEFEKMPEGVTGIKVDQTEFVLLP
jgi:hypothetical protein